LDTTLDISATAQRSTSLAPPAVPGEAESSSRGTPPQGVRRRGAFERATRPIPAGRVTTRRLIVALLVLCLGVFVAREAWGEIFIDYAFASDESSHIVVVPFVIALLIYVRRLRLRHFKIVGTLLGPLITLTGLAMIFAGYQFNRQISFHAGAVFIAIGCIVSVLGKGVIFRFGPAVVALLFLIPLPGVIRLEVATTMQNWTAHVAHVLLGAMNFETVVTGNTLTINEQPVTIAEACNGMRSVVTLLLLAYAFAFALPLRNGVRAVLLLASPLVAIGCNVIRTLPTILFYGFAPGWIADHFHWMAGYGMYVIAFFAWFGIVWLLRWTMLPIQRYTLASQSRT
jgi:exosortase